MLKAKTFRLPFYVIEYIEHKAKTSPLSQGEIIEKLVKEAEEKESVWQNDLNTIKSDGVYQKEALLMSEESYE